MKFPRVVEPERITRLQPPSKRVRIVLDTDTYNEIDDQFAVAYALLSPQQIVVEAIYAAPFSNERSTGPADGMEKSYEEILRLLDKLKRPSDGFVFRGATGYLVDNATPQTSDVARDLVDRAMRSTADDPLYVVAIGAITNVASAILLEPRIIERIVVVWLGGHALHWPDTQEFNLRQDVHAARLIFDCGVPLVHIPCMGVTSHLQTTLFEMAHYVRESGQIGKYLFEIFKNYMDDYSGRSKVLWDIATIAYLVNHQWVTTVLVHSPILTNQMTWSVDFTRHLVRYASFIDRDPVFQDLFRKLADYQGQ